MLQLNILQIRFFFKTHLGPKHIVKLIFFQDTVVGTFVSSKAVGPVEIKYGWVLLKIIDELYLFTIWQTAWLLALGFLTLLPDPGRVS